MKHADTEHNHDCFAEAASIYKLLRIRNDRVGFFIYVADADKDDVPADHHFRGNTAFAGGVFLQLTTSVLHGHVSGQCDHCDRVARALTAARAAFKFTMSEVTTSRC